MKNGIKIDYSYNCLKVDFKKGYIIFFPYGKYNHTSIILGQLKQIDGDLIGEVNFYNDLTQDEKDRLLINLQKRRQSINWFIGKDLILHKPQAKDLEQHYVSNKMEYCYRAQVLGTYDPDSGEVEFFTKDLAIKKAIMIRAEQLHFEDDDCYNKPFNKENIIVNPFSDINEDDIYTDDTDVVYGSKTIGYCMTNNGNFTGDIKFKSGIDENLKKAVLYKFNNNSLYNDIGWREVGKVEESIENKLKKENMNKITYPFTLYSYMNESKNERSEDLVYIYMEDDDDGWWESRCNLDNEEEFVIKSDDDYDEAMVALESLTSYDLGGENIFPDNFDEKLFSTGKAQYTFIDYEGKKSKCTMVAIPVQSLELSLAESFEKIMKGLQKEGLFENVKSFDLDFTGKGINIKLNEMAYKDDYREYNKKGKEYIKYSDRTLRQQDVLIRKLYQLKPVSFTFNDTIFTIKYDKASIGSYGFIWISFNAFKEQEQVGHGSIEIYDFQWHIMDQLNKKVNTSLDFTRYEKKLNSGEIKYRHKIADDVYDNADISRKDKETFINIFEKYLFEFLKPALYFDSTADNNNLYQTIRQNRRKKLNQVNSEVVNAQKKAEGSWRKEHFGVEGYEVGQTVEVFDGRTGDARSLGKIIKMTPSGTATIQLEDGTTIVRRNVENDEYVKLFQPFGRKYSVFDGDYRKKNLALPSASTEDTITNRKKVLDLE